jgi:hypothetical protein
MSKAITLLFIIVAILTFAFGLMYIIGAIKTKDRPPAYIGVVLIGLCIVCLYFLTFR